MILIAVWQTVAGAVPAKVKRQMGKLLVIRLERDLGYLARQAGELHLPRPDRFSRLLRSFFITVRPYR